VQSGTGFVWDEAGNIVTNVVAGTSEVAVRLSSGDVVRADIVGTAPNYDLGVIRLRDLTHLPPPIVVGSSADLKVGQFACCSWRGKCIVMGTCMILGPQCRFSPSDT
jgi:2-alkenal reductase